MAAKLRPLLIERPIITSVTMVLTPMANRYSTRVPPAHLECLLSLIVDVVLDAIVGNVGLQLAVVFRAPGSPIYLDGDLLHVRLVVFGRRKRNHLNGAVIRRAAPLAIGRASWVIIGGKGGGKNVVGHLVPA